MGTGGRREVTTFVFVLGNSKVRARVRDEGNGSYVVEYCASCSGFYSVTISLLASHCETVLSLSRWSVQDRTHLSACCKAAHCEQLSHDRITRSRFTFEMLWAALLMRKSSTFMLSPFCLTSPRCPQISSSHKSKKAAAAGAASAARAQGAALSTACRRYIDHSFDVTSLEPRGRLHKSLQPAV